MTFVFDGPGGAPASAAAAAAPASGGADLSEYGLPMPKNRVDPIVSTASADENRKSAQAWIANFRK